MDVQSTFTPSLGLPLLCDGYRLLCSRIIKRARQFCSLSDYDVHVAQKSECQSYRKRLWFNVLVIEYNLVKCFLMITINKPSQETKSTIRREQ